MAARVPCAQQAPQYLGMCWFQLAVHSGGWPSPASHQFHSFASWLRQQVHTRLEKN